MKKTNLEKRKREQVVEKLSDLNRILKDKESSRMFHMTQEIMPFRTQINDAAEGEDTSKLEEALTRAEALQHSLFIDAECLQVQIEMLEKRIIDNEFEF